MHALVLLAALPLFTRARKITVKNSCGTTIFPAYAGQGGAVTVGGKPAPGGWELAAGGSTILQVPEGWNSARIWIRSGDCDGNVTNCLLGYCASKGLLCDGTEFGSLGVTVAEFNINTQDFYDVSMVEGFTVPVTITPSDPSCTVGSCGIDDNPLLNCDSRLVYPKNTGQIWGCANPCTARVQFTALESRPFDVANSPSCCHGNYEDEKCTHNAIPFYSALKNMCKNGYVYAKDDLTFGGTQTAVFSCSSKPSYTVEFCAGGVNTGIKGAPAISMAKSLYVGTGGQLNVAGDSNGDGTPATQSVSTAASTTVSPAATTTAQTTTTMVTSSNDGRWAAGYQDQTGSPTSPVSTYRKTTKRRKRSVKRLPKADSGP